MRTNRIAAVLRSDRDKKSFRGRARSKWAGPIGGRAPVVETLEARVVLANIAATTVSELITAIRTANNETTNPGPDTITLTAGTTYTLTAADNYWYGPNGLPPITSNITIDGNGATITRSSAANTPNFRLIYVAGNSTQSPTLTPGTLILNDLTLQGGVAMGGNGKGGGGGGLGAGGAIYNQGSLTLDGVLVTSNTAQGGAGLAGSHVGGGGGMGGNGGGAGTGGDNIGGGGGFFGNGGTSNADGGAGGGGYFGNGGGDPVLDGNDGGAGGGGLFGNGANASGAPGTSGGGPNGGLGGATGTTGGNGANGGVGGGGGGGGSGTNTGAQYQGSGGNGGLLGGGGGGASGYEGGFSGNGGNGGFGGGGGSAGNANVLDDGAGGNGGVGGGGGGGFGGSGGNGGFGGGGGSSAYGNAGNGGFGAGAGASNQYGHTGTPGFAGGAGGDDSNVLGGGGAGLGGAIFNDEGSVAITNSTFTANSAIGGAGASGGQGLGGAVFTRGGTVSLTYATISGNTAVQGGRGLYLLTDGSAQPTATINDSILGQADNTIADLASSSINSTSNPIINGAANLVRDNGTAFAGVVGSADPLLSALGNYSGPTQTMPPLPGSPAIGAGAGADEIQDIKVTGTSGAFTLTFNGQTTPLLGFNATPIQVATDLTGLSTIGSGNVMVGLVNGAYRVTFVGALGGSNQAAIVGTGSGGATVNVTTVNNGSSSLPTTDQRGVSRPTLPDIGAVQTSGYVLTVTGGQNQSAAVGSAYANPLQVTVTPNNANDPVAGGSVSYIVTPSGSASVSLSSSSATIAANGTASVTATANTVVGSGISVAASTVGAASSAMFDLTNTAGAAASIAVVSGSGQSTSVNTGFSSPLVVVVKDTYGNPVSNASVTFTAPPTGASAAITGSPAKTNANGQASITLLTANTATGSYSVVASTPGVSPSATFSLTNVAGAAASVAVVSGSGQSTSVNTAFSNSLVVVVEDQFGNPVPNATVTFTAPPTGASAAITGSPATTNANGQASITLTANTTTGSYSVIASTPGVSPSASFSLTNIAGAAAAVAVVSGSGQSTNVGTAFTNSLVVVVEDQYGNPVPNATVTFTAPPTGPSAAITGSPATTGANGQASVTIKANGTPGAYSIAASVAGVPTPATFNLINRAQVVALFDQTKANNAGATVPIVIELTNGSGANIGSAGLQIKAVSVTGPGGVLQSPGNSQPGNLFTFNPSTGTYSFNLKTTGFKKGTFKFNFTIGNDPTLYSATLVIR